MFRATMAVSDQVLAGRRRGQGSEWVLYRIYHTHMKDAALPAPS